ncbi:heme A synthase [uncultured Deefgea sp.]|uniref:COX15/CtaA family protein n=1 Tax=uncultured Deefgea sp. TaxID=1304914 RepID=UPI002593AD63|nr:COX15/CtaA family protein [uncultured Deefgea sp.]
MIRALLLLTILWTFTLIMLGAYVRLSDAGLGCPDWPGCYGQLTAPDEPHEITQAEQTFGGEVHAGKGGKEMLHRYVAAGLGVLVLALAMVLWRQRPERLPRWLIVLPVLLIVFQALLGMWTVTLKLMPAVVTAHLLGGMILCALLVAIAGRIARPLPLALAGVRSCCYLALLLLTGQIVLGGWVSSNYAGLACATSVLCQNELAGNHSVWDAFRPDRLLGQTADGVSLSLAHLAAIQSLHRLGAMLVLLVVGRLIYVLHQRSSRLALPLAAALLLQIGLGISNVLFSLPLPLAVAHNGGAALLLAILVFITVRLPAAQYTATARLNATWVRSLL